MDSLFDDNLFQTVFSFLEGRICIMGQVSRTLCPHNNLTIPKEISPRVNAKCNFFYE